MRLLTDSCRTQTKEAIRYEGASTLESSFRLLGEVAGQELFSSPEVAEGMSGLENYVDEEKLNELLE